MTAPIVPPTGRNPAGSGQRAAARDHVTRLRQDGGTYRSIAAAAALSPAAVRGLASGRRRTQPGTAAAVLTVTSPTLPRARLDAGGTRLLPAVADQPGGDGDQAPPQGGDHRLAAADPVAFDELAAEDEAGELAEPGGDCGGDQRGPHPAGLTCSFAEGRCRSAAPCLESRKMFSMLVRCRYQCSQAAALAGVETSMLVQMKL